MTYTALEGHEAERAVRVLVVQLWHPVVAVIQHLVTGRCLGSNGNRVGLCLLEVRAADNSVNMAGELAGRDNRIGALNRQRLAVHGKQLSLRAPDQSHDQAGQRQLVSDHLDVSCSTEIPVNRT